MDMSRSVVMAFGTPFEPKSCTIGKIEFNYVKGASHGPQLLLLHGLTFRWQSFESVIRLLEPNCELYALDFRGHGGTGKAISGDYAFDRFVEPARKQTAR